MTAARVTEWDRAAGFGLGDDVVGARRAEDAAAAQAVGAKAIWLDLLDSQYGGDDSIDRCAEALIASLSALDIAAVFMPLGLHHSDHVRTREACLSARIRALAEARLPLRVPWYIYADAIYREIPDLLEHTLLELRARGRQLEDVRFQQSGPREQKRRAIACYPTQLRALDSAGQLGTQGIFTDERFWKLIA